MKWKLHCSVVVTFLLITAMPSHAQITKQGSKYLLRMVWAKGDKFTYGLKMNATMQNGQKMNMTASATAEVLAINNGVADVRITMNANGRPPNVQTTKMDKLGQVGDSSIAGSVAGQRFPEKALKIGESWTVSRDLQNAGVKTTVKTTYTLKSIKKYAGVDCAEVSVSARSEKGFQTSSKGTMLLELKNGQVMHQETVTEVVMNSSTGSQKVNSTTTVDRKK